MSFESINEYGCNFNNIREKLTDSRKEDIYYQKWMKNYSELFNRNDSFEIIEWKAREWRAIKEIYASAILYKESEFALKNRCMASYYFSLYYSLFHAMLSSICLDTNITLEKIIDINHSKVGKQFKNTYCNGKGAILTDDIYILFNKFKYLREYYSYTPPMNMPLYDSNYSESLRKYIIQCFQLTNLQSLILEKSFLKKCKSDKIDTPEKYYHLICSFKRLVSKPSIEKDDYILDQADKNVMREIAKYGIEFNFISNQLDYTFDEFRSYDGSCKFFNCPKGIDSQSIYAFIYDNI
ncbi:MAG: hypothetical protein E6610_03895 [Clostridium perfringens]|nr:hypothetical protein [Clostridium perfringens]